jgi:hypothetical protein
MPVELDIGDGFRWRRMPVEKKTGDGFRRLWMPIDGDGTPEVVAGDGECLL